MCHATEGSTEYQIRRTHACWAEFKAISPGDGVEGMLTASAVACRNLSMEYLMRAAHNPNNPISDRLVTRGLKLLAAFQRSLEVIERRRGKGRQHIVVERIDVRDGGQAAIVVGDQGKK